MNLNKENLLALISFNPFYNILNFEWGISLLSKKIKEGDTVHCIYIVSDRDYYRNKVKGKLFAKLNKKSIIDIFKNLLKDKENCFIFDYDDNKIVIVSDIVLSPVIKKVEKNITVGGAKKIGAISIGILFARATRALNEANVTKLKIKIL